LGLFLTTTSLPPPVWTYISLCLFKLCQFMFDCSSHRINFVFPSFLPLLVVRIGSVSSFQTTDVVLIRSALYNFLYRLFLNLWCANFASFLFHLFWFFINFLCLFLILMGFLFIFIIKFIISIWIGSLLR